ncbi:ureidoglycolate lyase [Endozoicomonas arenosclerae]|uniref:ureidoglycolate lyase n=1 Tax=Endozoicomonas arenosclerae TaxID=1633495 RepID=UPI0009A207CC|nr:ureidoglycolate lyase [Endozoicomonas arenosclerae]
MSQPEVEQHKPCIQFDEVVSLNDAGTHKVPMIRADAVSFAEYGRIVDNFEQEEIIIETWPAQGWRPVESGTGNEGGTTEGDFEFQRAGELMLARNHAVDGQYVTGWFADPATASADNTENVDYSRVLVREANYHPDGGQLFYPKNREPFVALLALPGDDVKPSDFVAFYCDGSFGIQIFPNIWHQPLYPVADYAEFKDKQGKVHACIAVDFVKEFNVYLEVPLSTPDTH